MGTGDMLLAHFGLALSGKYINSKQSLLSLVGASFAPDLVRIVFVFLHIESVSLSPSISGFFPVDHDIMGYSHSLIGVLLLAIILLVKAKSGRLLATLVVGHWVLDALMYRHDLPIWLGVSHAKVGLGWLDRPALFLLIELGLFMLGLWLYHRSRTGVYKIGKRFWITVMGVLGLFLGSILSTPKSIDDLIGYGPMLLLLPLMAWWIDYQRPQTYQSLGGLHRRQ